MVKVRRIWLVFFQASAAMWWLHVGVATAMTGSTARAVGGFALFAACGLLAVYHLGGWVNAKIEERIR